MELVYSTAGRHTPACAPVFWRMRATSEQDPELTSGNPILNPRTLLVHIHQEVRY
jgi:hypothetical protein